MRRIPICIYLTIVMIVISENIFATGHKTLYVIDLKKEIAATAWLYIQKGFQEAQEKHSDAVILHMNTYGGELVYADSIRTAIVESELPVYVFIDNNAASAGALIAIACDEIYMRKGASIGAATVVDQNGEKLPDKYQSYMRAMMRSTAESHGKYAQIDGQDTVMLWKRDPQIAEAMVDERTVIPGVVDSGRVLTFTALEAVKYHYCDGIVENIDEVARRKSDTANYTLLKFEPTMWDNLKGFMMNSVWQGILIMLIIGGIYFELQTPGIGFPLIVAISAAVLYFAPLYIDGLAASWEVLVFIIGLILIALELFVIPGFGLAGVSGIILVITGLTLSLLGNVDFDFQYVDKPAVERALITVISGVVVGFGLVLYLSSKIGSGKYFSQLALKATLTNKEGFIGVDISNSNIVGMCGVSSSVLRPSGKVKINNAYYDAVSLEGFIDKGVAVKVIRFETGQMYVEKCEED